MTSLQFQVLCSGHQPSTCYPGKVKNLILASG